MTADDDDDDDDDDEAPRTRLSCWMAWRQQRWRHSSSSPLMRPGCGPHLDLNKHDRNPQLQFKSACAKGRSERKSTCFAELPPSHAPSECPCLSKESLLRSLLLFEPLFPNLLQFTLPGSMFSDGDLGVYPTLGGTKA